MNILEIFQQQDAILMTVFLLLIGMSVISWWMIFFKISVNVKEQKAIKMFQSKVMSQLHWVNQLKQQDACCKNTGVETVITDALNYISSLPQGSDTDRKEKLLSSYLSQTLDNIRVGFDGGLTLLASVGSSAPFIGLFGTVWGIYVALHKISIAGNASLNVVAGPIGESLIATAVGLFAAIPAVLAYNYFVRRNRLMLQDLRHIAEQIALSASVSSLSKGA